MRVDHRFEVRVQWHGNLGSGTSGYRAYTRDHSISSSASEPIAGSSARVFHGNPERWNPEQLLVAALSQCHMLSYLHVATANGIVVESYRDDASGTLEQTANGGGHLTGVTLRPVVGISTGDPERALELHQDAHEKCFIAASVNFPVSHEPVIVDASLGGVHSLLRVRAE